MPLQKLLRYSIICRLVIVEITTSVIGLWVAGRKRKHQQSHELVKTCLGSWEFRLRQVKFRSYHQNLFTGNVILPSY
ncbi:hypothetical protein TNCV_1605501 [Trichonephila clavipes]|nr:hypothetical protein TNCV_1605501 [Trichonephila clavipes]